MKIVRARFTEDPTSTSAILQSENPDPQYGYITFTLSKGGPGRNCITPDGVASAVVEASVFETEIASKCSNDTVLLSWPNPGASMGELSVN